MRYAGLVGTLFDKSIIMVLSLLNGGFGALRFFRVRCSSKFYLRSTTYIPITKSLCRNKVTKNTVGKL